MMNHSLITTVSTTTHAMVATVPLRWDLIWVGSNDRSHALQFFLSRNKFKRNRVGSFPNRQFRLFCQIQVMVWTPFWGLLFIFRLCLCCVVWPWILFICLVSCCACTMFALNFFVNWQSCPEIFFFDNVVPKIVDNGDLPQTVNCS